MSELGADVDQIEALADVFERAGRELLGSGSATTSAVMSAWWRGPDADRTRAWWRTTARSSVLAAADELRDAAADLRRQAEQQRMASGTAGFGPFRPGHGAAPLVLEIGRWLDERGREASAWFGDRWRDLAVWGSRIDDGVDDVTDIEEDDLVLPPRGVGISRPFQAWAFDSAVSVADRGSTWLDYSVRTADRRLEHPFQTLVDLQTGTAFTEDVAAAQAIVGEDAEIVDDHEYEGDAIVLEGASAPDGADAITIGHTIRAPERPGDGLLEHEMQHVYDIEDVGGLGFYGSYGADYLWNRVVEGRGHDDAYEDIYWERRAYGLDGAEPEGILGGIWKGGWFD